MIVGQYKIIRLVSARRSVLPPLKSSDHFCSECGLGDYASDAPERDTLLTSWTKSRPSDVKAANVTFLNKPSPLSQQRPLGQRPLGETLWSAPAVMKRILCVCDFFKLLNESRKIGVAEAQSVGK